MRTRDLKRLAAPQPLAMTATYFREVYFPMSRSNMQQAIATGELETFVDGNRRMVLVAKARQFVKRRATAGSGPIDPGVSKRRAEAGRKGRAIQLAAAEHDPPEQQPA